MASQNVKLFLSCVSDEFGAERDGLRHELTGLTVDVAVQEDFVSLGADTLTKLDAYVRQCDVVVHIAGDMTGAVAKAAAVDALLARDSALAAALAEKGVTKDALMSLTYTQWEAWLALCRGKALVIAAPEASAPRGPKFAPTDEGRAAQAAHLARLRSLARYPEVKFANRDQFVKDIFKSLFAILGDCIRRAGQPRNLPFASLGDLFKGRETGMRHAAVFCAVTLGVSCGASATQLGLASFYDVAGLTAAHRSLPMGSRVSILNLDNGRSVVVRIVDRGPFIRGRIIDVSTAAAVTLGFREAGLARVRIDPIPVEAPEAASRPHRQAPSAPMDISYAICRYSADRLQRLQSNSLGGEAVAATRDMGCETSPSRLFDLAQRSEDFARLASRRVANLTEAEAAASIPVNAIAEMEAASSIPVNALAEVIAAESISVSALLAPPEHVASLTRQ